MRESVIYQSIIAEGLEKGREQGQQDKARQIAINMLQEGMPPEVIAKLTGLSIEVVEQLKIT